MDVDIRVSPINFSVSNHGKMIRDKGNYSKSLQTNKAGAEALFVGFFLCHLMSFPPVPVLIISICEQ